METQAYVEGISCPHCIDKTSASQRARFAERARQIELAKQRGTTHIGVSPKKSKSQKNGVKKAKSGNG
jgi:UPF0176 protein